MSSVTAPRRARVTRIAVLRQGFRPFFLGAAAWAPLALALWLALLAGALSLPLAFDALAWYQYEMLFGYAGGVVAGFLLTAVTNWTGQPPVCGPPLFGLVLLWAAARVMNLVGAAIGPWFAVTADIGFWAVLAGLILREIVTGRNWRNLPVAALVTCLGVGCALSQAGTAGSGMAELGRRLGFGVVFVLMGLIGGRVVPSFTRNWLTQPGAESLPVPMGWLDHAAMALLAVAILSWILAPTIGLTGCLLLAAGIGLLVRLARWCGAATLAEPLVLILHLGYGWLSTGLALLDLSILWPDVVGRVAAMHALTAGAVGTMSLAIMTRATLGHSGRTLAVDAATVWIYVLIQTGALLRVMSPVLPLDYSLVLAMAALLWGGAFVLFALHYGPMLATAGPG